MYQYQLIKERLSLINSYEFINERLLWIHLFFMVSSSSEELLKDYSGYICSSWY